METSHLPRRHVGDQKRLNIDKYLFSFTKRVFK